MRHREVLVELHGVAKDFQSLRPLRVANLTLHHGQSIALMGFDQGMAEVLVNLITGASVPDTGTVSVFGQPTASIKTAVDWVSTLDRFGLISERALLVDRFTAEQNLVMPLSLEIEDISPVLRARARSLADEVNLPPEELQKPTGSLPASSQLRIRLGRALALTPRIMLAEHPNALTSAADAQTFASDYARIVSSRELASLVITADHNFANAIAEEVLSFEPATGTLKPVPRWRRWLS
jgi:ABC-type transporter Mla maintaining outer membrane lipid asymmetry ATPase subunit MlaF